MKKNISFLLCFTVLILSGAGPSGAQQDTVVESEEESGIPVGTLLVNSPPDTLPSQDYLAIDLDQGRHFVIPKATKGFDEQKVLQDPLCDPTNRPTIETITPDEVRPGETMTVVGLHFGAKIKCLRSVTFGEYPAENLTLLEDDVFEVRVPKEVRAGLVFLNIVTNGGSARSAVLIKGQ